MLSEPSEIDRMRARLADLEDQHLAALRSRNQYARQASYWRKAAEFAAVDGPKSGLRKFWDFWHLIEAARAVDKESDHVE